MKSMKAIIIASVTVVGLMTGPVYAKRVALVIGNSDYQRAGDLRNPINDAQDLGLRLKQLGFELVGGQPQLNVTRSKLVSAGTQIRQDAGQWRHRAGFLCRSRYWRQWYELSAAGG